MAMVISRLRLVLALTAFCVGLVLVAEPAAQRGSTAPRVLTTQEIAARSQDVVVTITALDADGKQLSQGSGVVVRPSGVIITNWHVLRGASRAVVVLKSGETFDRVSFVDGDEAADLAIIKIPGYSLSVAEVTSANPDVGSRVVAIGTPLGLAQTVSEGIVSAIRLDSGRQLIQITAPISPGSSGGAVFDYQGRVFAISAASMEAGQQVNFAIPIKYALGLVPDVVSEKPLDSVFRESKAAASKPSGPLSSRLPERTNEPVATLEGTYLVEFSTGRFAILVLGKNDAEAGIAVVLDAPAKEVAPPLGILTARTNGQGEVAIDVGGMSGGGYQTAEGFVFSMKLPSEDGKPAQDVTAKALRFRPAISVDTGLYDLKIRTSYTSGSYKGDPVDWLGDAAVIVSNGAIYIDFVLKNADGGATGMFAWGRIDADGSFSISSDNYNSKSLMGTVRTGRIDARWIDQREKNSEFRGQLIGTRR